MSPVLQCILDQPVLDDQCYGTVPGAIFNELQREWQIQKRRAENFKQVNQDLQEILDDQKKSDDTQASLANALQDLAAVRVVADRYRRESDTRNRSVRRLVKDWRNRAKQNFMLADEGDAREKSTGRAMTYTSCATELSDLKP